MLTMQLGRLGIQPFWSSKLCFFVRLVVLFPAFLPISTKTDILGPAVYEKLPFLIDLRVCSQLVFYLLHLRMSQYTT